MAEVVNQFSFPSQVKDRGVLEARFWPEGFVILTADYEFWAVSDLVEPRPRPLADCALVESPTAWCIIDPAKTLSRNVEVFFATESGTIFVVDADGVTDHLLLTGPFTRLVPDAAGKLLAVYSRQGKFAVHHSSFQGEPLSELTLGNAIPPTQLVWCGNDSVLLYWPVRLDPQAPPVHSVYMIGPGRDRRDPLVYSWDEPIRLAPEIDGVRILSSTRCEFLQRVPDVTEQVFQIGSDQPAALLFDAYEHFTKKSPKSDELIRDLKKASALSDAVDACIEAAAVEFSYSVQRQLLQAASFGKSFLDFYYSDNFVEICKNLRILNCVRHPDIGIPLTYRQLRLLSTDTLVDRLVARNHHLLAWRICQYLGVKGDRVLVNWACAKVKASTNLNARQVCALVVERLNTVPGISYAEIASTAYKSGNPELATLLLDYEPRAADQVPLLISMQQYELALLKAIESGDTDLVYLVLLYIKRSLPPDAFFAHLRDKPTAISLLIKYSRQQDRQLLKDIYFREQRALEAGQLAAMEAYQRPELDSRINGLQMASHIFKEGGKDTAFETKATQDQISLLGFQRALERKAVEEGRPAIKLVDCSLSETLYRLIALDYVKRADKLRSDFKVPDSRYWWVKIRGLAAAKNWEELAALAKEKKSPIGYRPFVEVCIKAGANGEALRYVSRIEDDSDRLNTFIKLESFTDAADVAFQMKSLDALRHVKSRCTHAPSQAYIDKLMAQLQQ
ncbi:MAG: hypothetical protein Q8P67_07265 [archaeon]|nr:hypothetical protein [archaeon]